MADFVSSLNGVQMDAALIDMAEHNSEAYAVGERNGIPVGQGDVTYQNNARYYAQQAQSIAPASVTEAVRWDIAQTALTDANKAQARSNIDAGKNGAWSNRNLLDNAYFVGGGSQNGDGYFPINQRGLTTYSSSGRNLDRWSNDYELVLYSDGIASTGGAVYQGFVQEKVVQLLGKTLTASLLFNDGTLISGTATMPASLPASMMLISYNGAYGLCSILAPAWNQLFRFDGSTFGSKHLVAAKLEIGMVSTLANDIPPDFSIEYEKCRYYLRYIPLTRYPIAIDGANAYMTMVGMPMRGVPSPSLITAGGVHDAGGQSTITSATVTGYDKKIATVQFALSASRSYVVGYIYDTVLCLSAEI